MRSILRRIPGLAAVDRFLARHYLGAAGFREKFPRGHYYSPLPDLREVASPEFPFATSLPPVTGIDLAESSQLALFRTLSAFDAEFDWTSQPAADRRFHLGQTFFCEGDAHVLHAMLRHLAPRRVIEVGSGYSSALMLDTRERLPAPLELTFTESVPWPMGATAVPNSTGHWRLS